MTNSVDGITTPTRNERAPTELTWSPSRVARLLLTTVTILVVLGVAAYVLRMEDPEPETIPGSRRVARMFMLNSELSFPTFFSVAQLLLAAGLVAIVAVHHRQRSSRDARWWTGLAGFVLVLAIDEQVGLHEASIEPVRDVIGHDDLGILYYSWTIPGALLALGAALIMGRFVRRLPLATRRGVVLAGLLFVAGSLGVELLGGAWVEDHGRGNYPHLVLTTVEETAEILAVTLFVVTMLRHIADHVGPVRLRVEPSPALGEGRGAEPAPGPPG